MGLKIERFCPKYENCLTTILRTKSLVREDKEVYKWHIETFGEPAFNVESMKTFRWYPCWDQIYYKNEEDLTLAILRWT